MTNPKHHQTGRPENEPFRKLVASTEQMSKAVAPMMKCAACANMEVLSLAGRRTRAYLDLPNVLAKCRGPQDLLATQGQFWQTMVRDYAECSQRIVTAMQSFDGEVAENAKSSARERDTLVFPNVFGFPAWQLPANAASQRDEEDRAA